PLNKTKGCLIANFATVPRVLASNPGVVRIDKFERMKRKVERSADTKRVWRPFLISRFKLLVLVHAE
ncbi:hypothetical protein, partial [Klebsiella pneumoniae]|uniref:hypothetical protein n=1 Tax=Klebsiella pneumoniae TaxID=573 RepID=UPI003AF7DBCF